MSIAFDIQHFQEVAPNLFVSYKPYWTYDGVENYLLACTEYVRQHPYKKLLIVTNHPHCFTLGKGLQKLKGESVQSLIDFDENLPLPFELYKLKRGGGLTFHYPGQMVLYPIINLTATQLNVHDFMIDILNMTKLFLSELFNLNHLEVDQELLGLWYKKGHSQFKIASIGLAITRFTTYHGMALNFFHDDKMFQAIAQLNPCGLPGTIYQSVENLVSLEKKCDQTDLDLFSQKLISHFSNYFNGSAMTLKLMSSESVSDSISL